MPILVDFRCDSCDAVTEHLVTHSDVATPKCPECGSSATRKLIGAPKLAYTAMAADGSQSSDGMTTAIDKWHKGRMQKKALEQRNLERHGTYD